MSSMCHLWNDEEEAVLGWMVLQQMMDGSESNEFVMPPPPPLLQNVKVDLVISMIGKSKRDLHLHDRYIRNGYCTFHLVTYHPPGHDSPQLFPLNTLIPAQPGRIVSELLLLLIA